MKGLLGILVLIMVLCLAVMPVLAAGPKTTESHDAAMNSSAPDQANVQSNDTTAKDKDAAKDKHDSKISPVLLAGAAALAAASGGGSSNSKGSTATVNTVTPQSIPTSQVPEPATLTLLGLGIAGIAGYARKRLRK